MLYGNLLKWICIDIEGSWLLIEPFLGKKKEIGVKVTLRIYSTSSLGKFTGGFFMKLQISCIYNFAQLKISMH